MAPEYHWSITVGLVTSSVIAVTANLLLLIVFCRRRGLRTIPNRFVINLLLTNLVSSFLLIPLLLVDQETAESESPVQNTTDVLNDVDETIRLLTIAGFNLTDLNCVCYLAQSGTSLVCTASIFSILLIGINQYFAVIHSLRYHFYISKLRCMAFIYTGWLVAVVFGVLGAVSQNHSSLWHFCDRTPKASPNLRIFNTAYAFVYFIFMILAPFIAISAIYVRIYSAARRNSERMRKSTTGGCNGHLDAYLQVPQDVRQKPIAKVQSAPNFLDLVVKVPEIPQVKVTRTASERITNNFINCLKYRISNASVFRYREETKAAKVSIIVIFTVLVCYIPYGITLILNSDLVDVRTPRQFNYVALVLLIISNIISPFLFAYRNKRIQREVGKFLGLVNDNSKKLSVRKRSTRRASVPARTRCEVVASVPERFLVSTEAAVPEVVVTCKSETEKKSILKRVCSGKGWSGYKKCSFITVPDSCLSAEARGSFSSASTQISTEE